MPNTSVALEQEVKKGKKHNIIKRKLESQITPEVNKLYYNDAKWFIEQMHKDSDDTNFLSLFTKDIRGYKNQYSLRLSELMESPDNLTKILNLVDLYVSVNTFYYPGRQKHNVRRLNAAYIDLDYYKIPRLKGLEPRKVINLLRSEGMFDKLEPSFFVGSGNGLYILYLLENCNYKASQRYQVVLDELWELFKPYGADEYAKDVSRVLRIPGSYNTKGHEHARIIYNSNKLTLHEQLQEKVRRYTLEELEEAFVPPKPSWYVDWKESKKSDRKAMRKEQVKKVDKVKKVANNTSKKVSRVITIKNLYWHRIQDLQKVQTFKNEAGIIEGHREFMCYLYRLFELHFTGGDKAMALEETMKFNEGFLLALDESEVIQSTAEAETNYENYVKASEEYDHKCSWTLFAYQRGCNLYSNKKLIEVLDITPEQQRQLSTIKSKEVLKEQRKERNHAYYEAHKEEILTKKREKYKKKVSGLKKDKMREMMKKIKSLRDEGFSNKMIATELDVSPDTLKRYIKAMIKEGLLQ